jgi:hypothetical protein
LSILHIAFSSSGDGRIGLNQSSFGLASVVSFAILEFLGCFCFGDCLAVDFPFEIRRRQDKKEEAMDTPSPSSLSRSQAWLISSPVWGTFRMFPQVLNQCWPVLVFYEEPLVAILQNKLEQFQFEKQWNLESGFTSNS